jgi:hypothetical protein
MMMSLTVAMPMIRTKRAVPSWALVAQAKLSTRMENKSRKETGGRPTARLRLSIPRTFMLCQPRVTCTNMSVLANTRIIQVEILANVTRPMAGTPTHTSILGGCSTTITNYIFPQANLSVTAQ